MAEALLGRESLRRVQHQQVFQQVECKFTFFGDRNTGFFRLGVTGVISSIGETVLEKSAETSPALRREDDLAPVRCVHHRRPMIGLSWPLLLVTLLWVRCSKNAEDDVHLVQVPFAREEDVACS